MTWPLSQDYNESIQTPAQCFTDPDLRRGEAVTNAMGLPVPCSGNFADVYAVQVGQRKWAVKCFTRQIPGLKERYAEISKYLAQVRLPFMVEFSYLDQGIRVRNQWYPILKMEWVEGQPLNIFVREQVGNSAILQTLCKLWVKMASALRRANLAHGDLQHGNVLLVPGSKAGKTAIRLVDYDGMCVPSLEMLKATEVGHPAYQHPQRLREATYGLQIDSFSNLVIYTAIRALAVGGPKLWERYDNGDNLLFTEADFANPQKAAVFQDLTKLPDPEVKKLLQALAVASQKPVTQTPLLEALVPAEEKTERKTGVVEAEPPNPNAVFASATASGNSTLRLTQHRQGKRPIDLLVAAALVLVVLLGAGVLLLGGNGGSQSSKNAVALATTGKQKPKSPRSTEEKSLVEPPEPQKKLPVPEQTSIDQDQKTLPEPTTKTPVDFWNGALVIVKADYGSDQHRVDVAQKIKGIIATESFPVVSASNDLAGDPHVSALKWMNVEYRLGNDKLQSARVNENDVFFPIQGAKLPGTAKNFVIRAARYGSGSRWANVMDKAVGAIRDPYASFTVPSGFTTTDPAPGVFKHLVVGFDYDGSRYMRAFRDGTASLLKK